MSAANVAHLAELASLSLTEEEGAALAKDLDAIVSYVGELNELDTEGVEPTSHVQLGAAEWRTDEPRPCLTQDEALAQAPQTSEGGFVVPRFVES